MLEDRIFQTELTCSKRVSRDRNNAPYFVLNYVLGLTPIGVTPYAVASFLGLLPSMSAITYAGHVGFEAINSSDGLTGKLILAVALVGLAALVPIVVRILRKRKATDVPVDL